MSSQKDYCIIYRVTKCRTFQLRQKRLEGISWIFIKEYRAAFTSYVGLLAALTLVLLTHFFTCEFTVF